MKSRHLNLVSLPPLFSFNQFPGINHSIYHLISIQEFKFKKTLIPTKISTHIHHNCYNSRNSFIRTVRYQRWWLFNGKSAVDIARELLQKLKTLRAMSGIEITEFKQISGLKNAKIAHLKAAIELGRSKIIVRCCKLFDATDERFEERAI